LVGLLFNNLQTLFTAENSIVGIMNKRFWIGLCLVNLCIVAFFGFGLRSKILFPLPFIDYRYLLSAHSHFAFGGWVGLSLITLLIYDLLPPERAKKRIYLWLLAGIEISSLGMAFFFPFQGYSGFSVFFSSLYIVVTYVLAPFFLKDLLNSPLHKKVKLLAVSAIISLLISAIGPLGLSYILLSGSGNSLLYRDSIYTFLHFQYNGFFTLSVFALLFNRLKNGFIINSIHANRFPVFLVLSVVPSLFLSLLWHNSVLFYFLAGAGCLLILLSLTAFLKLLTSVIKSSLFHYRLARNLWLLSAVSFALKMLLNIGTIFPSLGNAIYGNRPVIIGFLHLVFLAFVSFYLLSSFIESHLFTKKGNLVVAPFFVFGLGIVANETLLMLQGLEILFQSNSSLYNWLLWCASIILFVGAISIVVAWYSIWAKKPWDKTETALQV